MDDNRRLPGTATGLSGTVSTIGGLIVQFGTALLDTEVARGVKAIIDAVFEKNPITRNLFNPNLRRMLEDIEDETGKRRIIPPVQPKSSNNNVSLFDENVQGGAPVILDPEIAEAFVYKVDLGSPLFNSFALQYLGDQQQSYLVELWGNNEWVPFIEAFPLVEYEFDTPVSEFRVSDIKPVLGLTGNDDPRWFTMVTFAEDGRFKGTIEAELTGEMPPTVSVPEPSTIVLFALGIAGLAATRRRWKAAA